MEMNPAPGVGCHATALHLAAVTRGGAEDEKDAEVVPSEDDEEEEASRAEADATLPPTPPPPSVLNRRVPDGRVLRPDAVVFTEEVPVPAPPLPPTLEESAAAINARKLVTITSPLARPMRRSFASGEEEEEDDEEGRCA